MPRQYIDSRTGFIRYRSRLLTPQRAESFKRLLRANSRFTDVQDVDCPTAKGARFVFVTYAPASPAAMYRAAGREQAKRDLRAERESGGYLWRLDVDGRVPFYRCCSLSRECYEVSEGSCTCPDFEFRCKRALWSGLKCKHIRAYEAACEAGELVPIAEAFALPEWRAAHPWPKPAAELPAPRFTVVASVGDAADYPD